MESTIEELTLSGALHRINFQVFAGVMFRINYMGENVRKYDQIKVKITPVHRSTSFRF